MSPILVRPVREQLEHDRVIRLLQQDLQKRKVEVGINPGSELNAAIGSGTRKEYPDAVVYSREKGRKVVAVVEVETGESVNHLEAMAQWAHFAKLKVPFHLYVPMGSVDVARRLSNDYNISVSEIWSYHQVGEQFKFTLIHPAPAGRGRAATPPPRTVSVASIRVAPPPELELDGGDEGSRAPEPEPEPIAKSAPRTAAAPTTPARKTIPVKLPPKPVPAAKTAPARSVNVPAKVVKPAVAKTPAPKVVARKATPVSPAVPRSSNGPKAAAKGIPTSRGTKATKAVKARPGNSAKHGVRPAKGARPGSKSARSGSPSSKSVRRPVAKRK